MPTNWESDPARLGGKTLEEFIAEEQPEIEAAETAETAELRTYVPEGKKGEFDSLVKAGVTADVLSDTIERWVDDARKKEDEGEEEALLKGKLTERGLKLREEAATRAAEDALYRRGLAERALKLREKAAAEKRGTIGEKVRGPVRKYVGPGLAGAHTFGAKESLYVPKAPSVKGLGGPAKEALRPELGGLREATRLGTGTRAAGDLSALREAGRPSLERLRGGDPFARIGLGQAPVTTQLPRNWSEPMKAVYLFLQERGGRVLATDVDELVGSRTAASQAVAALTSMGYITKEGRGQTAELMLTERVPA